MNGSLVNSWVRDWGCLRVVRRPSRYLLLIAAFAACLGIAGFAGSPALAASPSNDDIANAEVLSGTSTSVGGTLVDATFEASEPTYGTSNGSVWYRWTAPASGQVTVGVSGALTGGVAVHTGSTIPTLLFVNAAAGSTSFAAISGTTYYMSVGSFDSAAAFTLQLDLANSGSISGSITDASSNPLEDICVQAYTSTAFPSEFGKTDANGDYLVDGLEAGDYRLAFYDCGNNNVAAEYYDDKQDLPSADSVTVTPGTDTGGIDAELAPAGTISGNLTDDASNPLDNMCITAYDAVGDFRGSAHSDPSGDYSIGGLATGHYRLRFADCLDNNNVVDEFYDDKPDLASADPVSVVAGVESPGIDAVFTTAGSVSGTVTDHLSSPLVGICVVVFDSNEVMVGSGNTDTNGDYSIDGLETADYRLAFYGCSVSDFVVGEYYNDKRSFDSANPVAVTVASDTPNIDAQLSPGGSISGTVTDSFSNPASGVCVDAYDSSGNIVGNGATSFFDGSYTIGGLPPGDYRLRFRNCFSFGTWAGEYFDDKQTLGLADPVTVTAGSDASGNDAELAPGGSISGTVSDSLSNPVPGLCVRAFDSEGNLAIVRPPDITGSNGGYTIDGLSTGDYRLEFSDCLGTGETVVFYDDEPDLASADPVSVTSGSTTSGIDLQFASDSTPPDTTIDSGPSGTIATDQATFTFSGNPAGDTAKVQCKIDSGAFADCTSPKTFTGLADGPHTATFRAEDAAGNQDPTPATRTFTVDTTPPDTTIDSGPSGTIATDQATFTFSGNPAGDTAKVQCRIDSGAFADCTSPRPSPALPTAPTPPPSGPKTQPETRMRPRPPAPSPSTQPRPTPQSTPAPPEPSQPTRPPSPSAVTRPATQPRSSAGSTPEPSPTAHRPRPSPALPTAPTPPPSGPKTQPETRMRPRPPAPSPSTQPRPTPQSTPAPPEPSQPTRPPSPSPVHPAGDTAKVQCRIDSEPFADCAHPEDLLRPCRRPPHGRPSGPRTRSETRTRPRRPAASPSTRHPPDTTDRLRPLRHHRNRPGHLHLQRRPGRRHSQGPVQDRLRSLRRLHIPKTFSGLADGPHTVTFRAEDAAGNQDPTPATRTFTVDTTPPDTTIDSGPTGTIATDQATFTFSGDPAGDTARSSAGSTPEPFADCTSPKTFTGLADGPHTADLQGRGRSRKPGCDPGDPHLHRRHTPPPTPPIDSGPTGTIATDQATFTFAGDPAGDTAKVQCKIDAEPFADCTSPRPSPALPTAPTPPPSGPKTQPETRMRPRPPAPSPSIPPPP